MLETHIIRSGMLKQVQHDLPRNIANKMELRQLGLPCTVEKNSHVKIPMCATRHRDLVLGAQSFVI